MREYDSVDALFGELAKTYKPEVFTILVDSNKMLVTPNNIIPRDRPVKLSEIRKLATMVVPFTKE